MATDHPFKTTRIPSATPNQANNEENEKQELAMVGFLARQQKAEQDRLDLLLTPQEKAARDAKPKPTRPRVNDDNDYEALEDLDHDPDATSYTEEQLLYGEDADFSDEDPEAPSMEIEW